MEDFCQTHDDVFFLFSFFRSFFFDDDSTNAIYEKKQNKNQRKISLLAANGNL